MEEYNSTSKINRSEIDFFSGKLSSIFDAKNLSIHVSNSPRAIETAKIIFPNQTQAFQISSIYREFQLDIVKIPLFKFKVKTWFIISRLIWFFNVFKQPYYPKIEIHRAQKVSQELVTKDHMENLDIVILVAHGFLNQFISKYLIKIGYELKENFNKQCFAVKIYEN